jgi:hypothetical protein
MNVDRQEASGDRLSWIFGSSRSGSTWLLRMLAELPGAAAIDDPHIGHHLGTWRPISLAWAAAEKPPDLTTLRAIKREKPSYFFNDRYEHAWRPALRALIEARFTAEAEEQRGRNRRATFVKEPGSQAIDLLLSLFPSSNLIWLLRDGRDVVDSWIDAYQRDSWAIDEGAFAAERDGRLDLVRWQASVWSHRTEAVGAAYEHHDPNRRILIRYEDLLDDPVRELHRICSVVGIDAGDTRLREIEQAHRFSELPRRERGSGHEQRAAQPGGWRSNLTPEERAAMERIMGPQLERVGYLGAGVPARVA